ncbi:MAG: hypothetical protein IPM45_05845 [Acidimicrobiales bacterium]|nr:hypothetical protein [Acidimicrobiales bacterium]
MRVRRLLGAGTLALLLVGGIAACGDDDDSTSDTTAATDTTDTTETTAAPDTTTEGTTDATVGQGDLPPGADLLVEVPGFTVVDLPQELIDTQLQAVESADTSGVLDDVAFGAYQPDAGGDPVVAVAMVSEAAAADPQVANALLEGIFAGTTAEQTTFGSYSGVMATAPDGSAVLLFATPAADSPIGFYVQASDQAAGEALLVGLLDNAATS